MCVLCGEALTHIHWTDQRADERVVVSMLAGDDYQRSRMRDRLHVVRLANRILRYYGLHLDDWNGSKYVLSDRKGSSVIVQDVGSLWASAEKLVRRPLDPLDSSLLEALQSQETA
jgi:hypothetical protein